MIFAKEVAGSVEGRTLPLALCRNRDSCLQFWYEWSTLVITLYQIRYLSRFFDGSVRHFAFDAHGANTVERFPTIALIDRVACFQRFNSDIMKAPKRMKAKCILINRH